MRPADLRPASELAEGKPHGTRIKYVGGCRCGACREANTLYERARAKSRRRGDANGLVDAGPTREHLLELARAGVGLRTVADITGIPRSTLTLIRSGKRTQLRARSARAIARVAPGVTNEATLVPAYDTWVRVNELLALGLTKTRLAELLGSTAKKPAFQVRASLVTAKTAQAVARLHRKLLAGLRLKHEIRQEMRAHSERGDEVESVLELRAERARALRREAAREKRRAS